MPYNQSSETTFALLIYINLALVSFILKIERLKNTIMENVTGTLLKSFSSTDLDFVSDIEEVAFPCVELK